MIKNDIMNLDIKIGYNDILKNDKILNNLTLGQLKGIHYKLHKSYNLKSISRDIKILIYKAHNLLLDKFNKLEFEHNIKDKLDIQLVKKEEIKQIELNKKQVFLLRRVVKKNG